MSAHTNVRQLVEEEERESRQDQGSQNLGDFYLGLPLSHRLLSVASSVGEIVDTRGHLSRTKMVVSRRKQAITDLTSEGSRLTSGSDVRVRRTGRDHESFAHEPIFALTLRF
jgi:hypothetical protein